VLSSAAAVAVATQRRADCIGGGGGIYDCPTAARSQQVSGHVVLLDAQSASPSADRSHSHALEVRRQHAIVIYLTAGDVDNCAGEAGEAGDVFSHTRYA